MPEVQMEAVENANVNGPLIYRSEATDEESHQGMIWESLQAAMRELEAAAKNFVFEC
jgi:hypothetical protein